MAMEFTQTLGTEEIPDNGYHLVIPRLSKKDIAAVKFGQLSSLIST